MKASFIPSRAALLSALVLPGARVVRTLATTAAVLGFGMLTGIMLARWLGPSGRGEIAAALLWPTLLVYLAAFGLIHSILYHGAQAELDRGRIYGTGLLLAVAQSIPALAIGYVAMPLLLKSQSPEVVAASRLFLLIVPISMVAQFSISLVQARMHFGTFNALRLIIPIGYFAGIFVLRRFWTISPHSIVVLHLTLGTVTMLGAMIALDRLGIVQRIGADLALARRLLSYGGKVYAGGISQAANLRLDQVLLSAFFPPVALGIYVTATSVSNLLGALASSVQMVVVPTVANFPDAAGRPVELQRLFRRFWWVNIAAALALAAASPVLIPLLFGKAFSAAVLPTMILIVGAMFIGAKDVLSGGAQGLGDPWLGSLSEIIALFVTMILLLLLLPPLGIVGAALASTAAYFTQFVVVVLGLKRRHGIPPRGLLGVRGPAPVVAPTVQ